LERTIYKAHPPLTTLLTQITPGSPLVALLDTWLHEERDLMRSEKEEGETMERKGEGIQSESNGEGIMSIESEGEKADTLDSGKEKDESRIGEEPRHVFWRIAFALSPRNLYHEFWNFVRDVKETMRNNRAKELLKTQASVYYPGNSEQPASGGFQNSKSVPYSWQHPQTRWTRLVAWAKGRDPGVFVDERLGMAPSTRTGALSVSTSAPIAKGEVIFCTFWFKFDRNNEVLNFNVLAGLHDDAVDSVAHGRRLFPARRHAAVHYSLVEFY
jgi:hypothetical protein